VYLTLLDKAFDSKKELLYLRYMDDIVILTKTKRQYQKTKKRLFSILRTLKLTVSPRKTWMGKLSRGFHFVTAPRAKRGAPCRWHSVMGLSTQALIKKWVGYTTIHKHPSVWVGRGLLLGSYAKH
jgi:hypothetical protein